MPLGEVKLIPWGLVMIVAGIYAALVGALLIFGRREDARALAGFIPDCVVMIGRLAKDPGTSRRHRLMLVALLAYLALPIDLVPDFIPVAGQLDDAVLVAVALRVLLHSRSPEQIAAAWPGPPRSLALVMRAAGVPPHAAG